MQINLCISLIGQRHNIEKKHYKWVKLKKSFTFVTVWVTILSPVTGIQSCHSSFWTKKLNDFVARVWYCYQASAVKKWHDKCRVVQEDWPMTVWLKLPISQTRALFYIIVDKSLSNLIASKIRVTKTAYPCFNNALLTLVTSLSSVGNIKKV